MLPVWLELVRNGSVYTGYYSFDGSDWLTVGTATVAGQGATQDAEMFVTSHAAGSPGQVTFDGFAAPGGAVIQSCPTCYGGQKAGFVGEGGTLTFNSVTVPAAGIYDVTLVYCVGLSGTTGRQADISADGGTPQLVSFTPTGSFSTVGALTVRLPLNAGPTPPNSPTRPRTRRTSTRSSSPRRVDVPSCARLTSLFAR